MVLSSVHCLTLRASILSYNPGLTKALWEYFIAGSLFLPPFLSSLSGVTVYLIHNMTFLFHSSIIPKLCSTGAKPLPSDHLLFSVGGLSFANYLATLLVLVPCEKHSFHSVEWLVLGRASGHRNRAKTRL